MIECEFNKIVTISSKNIFDHFGLCRIGSDEK